MYEPRIYRFVCEKCGRVTYASLFTDCVTPLYRRENGEEIRMILCPEHRAQWERMISHWYENAGA